MSEEEIVQPEDIETPEEEVVTETEETPEEDEETVESLTEKNKKLFARAKKAEGFEQDTEGKWVKKAQKLKESTEIPLVLTEKDRLALIKADIDPEDLDEITDFASFKKISVSEALKSPTLKKILAENVEMRTTESVTNTKRSTRGTTKPSDEAVLARASKETLEATDDNMTAIFRARQNARKSQRK